MCIANAYLIRHGTPEMIMENVETVQAIETNVWNLSSLFGEEKRIVGRLKCLQLLENQLFFEELP
ncbi:hypothetical protein DSCW_59830 [Desulfosarcina widdelii]|uniref:RNA-binding protein n=1 Tax=Desulfosarcina widdelii TaxID=947919 RepID=A0A5K7Z9N6_9BACT|nr:CooT family nickel-binding protein [Desulfosarcina widdelii]BBO78566.1 hypothetical protein DSCW_59830 [Desulfosarcina widdelii]